MRSVSTYTLFTLLTSWKDWSTNKLFDDLPFNEEPHRNKSTSYEHPPKHDVREPSYDLYDDELSKDQSEILDWPEEEQHTLTEEQHSTTVGSYDSLLCVCADSYL